MPRRTFFGFLSLVVFMRTSPAREVKTLVGSNVNRAAVKYLSYDKFPEAIRKMTEVFLTNKNAQTEIKKSIRICSRKLRTDLQSSGLDPNFMVMDPIDSTYRPYTA